MGLHVRLGNQKKNSSLRAHKEKREKYRKKEGKKTRALFMFWGIEETEEK
jgi:hypothetical protein